MSGNLKAYHVSNDDGYGQIIFAETPGKAKARNSFYADFLELRATRAKWADKYQGQKIPKQAYLENGWWFECKCLEMQTEETAIVIDEVIYCEKCVGKAGGK
jgi:hypothetical protein